MIDHNQLAQRQRDRDPLSESGAFRILSECEENTADKLPENQRHRECPRCHQQLTDSARVCKHCHLYLAVSDQTWRNALQAAVRSLKRR
jgi:hypothetical protein